MKINVLLILIVILLIGCLQKDSILNKLNNSDELLKQNKFLKADSLLNEILKAKPRNTWAHNNKGYIQAKYFQNHRKALHHYQIALESDPNNKQARINELVAHFDLNECKLYLSKLKKFESEFKITKSLIFSKGECFKNTKDYSKSLKIFNELELSMSNSAELFKERSEVNRKLGYYNQSLNDALKAISLDSNYHQAFNSLGIIYEVVDSFDLAYKSFSKAINLSPESKVYYFNRGNMLHSRMGLIKEVKSDLQKSMSLGSEEAIKFLQENNIILN